MMTKNEIAEKLIAKGIALPPNWGKLSVARAQALLDIAETTATKSVAPIIGAGLGRVAGAVLAAAGAVAGGIASVAETIVPAQHEPEDTRRPQAKKATMPKNPNWGRSEKPPGKRQFMPVRKLAADPEPITRQVRRQNERRDQKMPIGARQEGWHKVMDFGKVGPGKRRKGAAA